MNIRYVTARLGESKISELEIGDYFETIDGSRIYKKIAEDKIEVIKDYTCENKDGMVVSENIYKDFTVMMKIKILDKIAEMTQDVSLERLLELEIIEKEEDFEEFMEYADDRQKHFIEEEYMILGDYADDYYHTKNMEE